LLSTGFVLACAACALTADTLSGESREGTIGLLFLTDLRSWDVTLGKLRDEEPFMSASLLFRFSCCRCWRVVSAQRNPPAQGSLGGDYSVCAGGGIGRSAREYERGRALRRAGCGLQELSFCRPQSDGALLLAMTFWARRQLRGQAAELFQGIRDKSLQKLG